MTAGADDRLTTVAAATGRVRAMVAALTDPVPALLHAVAAAEGVVGHGPALPVVDVDPFAAIPGAADVVPEGRTPGRARRGGRVTTPARRPADPPTSPMTTTPGASRPVEPAAAATEERHDVTAPSADPGRQTASRTAGDPASVEAAERTFAVLATRRVDAVLARGAGDAATPPRESRAIADAIGIGERPPAGAGRGAATSTERDPGGGRPGTAAAAFGAPATGDAAVGAAVTREQTPPPPPARPRPDAAWGDSDVEPVPRSRGLGDGTTDHANGFALRRGGAPAATGASALARPTSGASAGSASDGGPVHIPEVTIAARPGVAAPGPSGPPALPLDPEDLAALVNEVLAEQARRHGVDLS